MYYELGTEVTISKYIEFCHFRKEDCWDDIKKFCEEQFINNYHLFGTDLVVNSLLNEYNLPTGLVASLQDNVDHFTQHLKAWSANEDDNADCSDEG